MILYHFHNHKTILQSQDNEKTFVQSDHWGENPPCGSASAIDHYPGVSIEVLLKVIVQTLKIS